MPADNPVTRDREGSVLIRLTGPMVVSMLSVILFNLVDTIFVGRLGSEEMAALSFTFPVVMVIGSVAHGLGAGLSAAVSHAVGRQDRRRQVRLITWGLLLAMLVVAIFAFTGVLTLQPLFTLLGARGEVLTHIAAYMRIWYPGAIFLVVPMAANAALYGLGDTRTPSRVILAATLVNAGLDPFLIFGLGPFPRMGVAGAALATVMARGLSFFVLMYVLIARERVICPGATPAAAVFAGWREILRVGIPNVLTRLIGSAALIMLTALVAVHGSAAVAGFGIATRLELFAMIIISALAAVMPVFVGQNRGAGLNRRVLRAVRLANRFTLIYGAVICLALYALAVPMAGLFNTDPQVKGVAVTYLQIVSLSYGFMGMMQINVATLNVLKKPLLSAGLTAVQVFGLCLPMAWFAPLRFGLGGLFGALAFSYLVTGTVSRFLSQKYLGHR